MFIWWVEEYLDHKNGLLKERERLKERINDTEHGANGWLELTEKTFNFACYTKYRFENGRLEQKNTILQTMGSNFSLKDRKLFIALKNPWLIIRKGLENERKEKGWLEPSKTPVSSMFDTPPDATGSVWLPCGDRTKLELFGRRWRVRSRSQSTIFLYNSGSEPEPNLSTCQSGWGTYPVGRFLYSVL